MSPHHTADVHRAADAARHRAVFNSAPAKSYHDTGLARDINITLDKNIDLTGKGWTPIGTSFDNSYKGIFDGGGHTITGLAVTTNDQFVGLFGYLNRAGTVKNVVMEGIQITSNHGSSQAGGVVGFSRGTIENCSVLPPFTKSATCIRPSADVTV